MSRQSVPHCRGGLPPAWSAHAKWQPAASALPPGGSRSGRTLSPTAHLRHEGEILANPDYEFVTLTAEILINVSLTATRDRYNQHYIGISVGTGLGMPFSLVKGEGEYIQDMLFGGPIPKPDKLEDHISGFGSIFHSASLVLPFHSSEHRSMAVQVGEADLGTSISFGYTDKITNEVIITIIDNLFGRN